MKERGEPKVLLTQPGESVGRVSEGDRPVVNVQRWAIARMYVLLPARMKQYIDYRSAYPEKIRKDQITPFRAAGRGWLFRGYGHLKQ